ncbi:hypothetical protein SprV_0200775200 [Sparganum proliferum]
MRTSYTFFWSDRPTTESRDAGVTFAIRNNIVEGLSCLPPGINDRIMSLRLHLRGKKFATVVSTYASTMTSPGEVKNMLYEDLHSLLASVPKANKLVAFDDFNALTGT